MSMTPRVRTESHRPIRRASSLPPGMARVLAALRPYRHQLRPGAAETLTALWGDLYEVRGAAHLEELVLARLAAPGNARHLVGSFDPHDRVGAPRYTQLWRPAAGAGYGDVEGGAR